MCAILDTRRNNMVAALSLSQAARLTGLGKITITRAIKSSWHSATGKVYSAYDIEAAEPEPSARQSRSLIAWNSSTRLAQAVTQAELRQRLALAEEKLADMKTALDEMRAQRDAWQAMAQARIRAPASAKSP
jgi:hypothetical protein